MRTVTLNLKKALENCPESGMVPTTVTRIIQNYLLPTANEAIKITLKNGKEMYFLSHIKKDKIVLTSAHCLSSGCPDGVSLEELPELLAKLAEKNVRFTALQFPHAFKVAGRFSGNDYRAHYNHIVLYKDATNNLNASIIDSTINPLGVYNPIPLIGWMVSNSILSGEELLQVKFSRLLGQADVNKSLLNMADLNNNARVNVTPPILTYKQPSIGDKRCGIYVLLSMASIINSIHSDVLVTPQTVPPLMSAAHQAVNDELAEQAKSDVKALGL